MKKTTLLDLFGRSSDPADHARLDDLFLRLESGTPTSSEPISILIEGGSNCGNQLFSTRIRAVKRLGRLKLIEGSTSDMSVPAGSKLQ